MDHILSYSIYESSEQYIADYIEDIFFEFSDGEEWVVIINKDVEIHQRDLSDNKILYGSGFFTTSDITSGGKLREAILKKYQDWKLGFLVTISIPNPLRGHRIKDRRRRGVERIKDIDKKKQEQDKNLKNIEKIKIINFVRRKSRLIKKRCPKGVTLYGVIQIDDIFNDNDLKFQFSFIYDEFK